MNDLQSRVVPLVLDWGNPLPREILAAPPTHILAADCVYFEPAFPLLTQTLKDIFELSPDCTVFFCFKKRRRADIIIFLKNAKKVFNVEELQDDDKPVWQRQGLYLFSFKKKT